MPDYTKDQGLPFISRNQLDFESGTRFGLQVDTIDRNADTIRISGFTKQGPFSYQFDGDGSGNVLSTKFNLTDMPIGLSAVDPLGNIQQGEFFCTIYLTINGDKVMALCSGYIYTEKGVSYPQGAYPDLHPNMGFVRGFQGANPAAGAQIADTMTNGQIWRLRAAFFRLVTDATVANRRVHFGAKVNTRKIFEVWSDTNQTATQTIDYSVCPVGAIPSSTDNNVIIIPMPRDIVLPPGSSLYTTITNGVAGDDLGAPDYLIESTMGF